MDFSVILHQPRWQTVYTIPQGIGLQKGRHGLYHNIAEAAGSVGEKFGCYSWRSDSTIFYCGSFAQDYRCGKFRTNLEGRIHQYLQNHGRKDAKRKNTNLIVFENINAALREDNVLLCLFMFQSLQIGDDKVNFAAFSTDPDLVHVVEQLLICSYRRQGQCQWNRA